MNGLPSDSRSTRFLLPLIVLAAVALRLWRIGLGFPDFQEEAIPLRLALGLVDPATGRMDPNPHQFNYPSLSVYVHFALQWVLFQLARLSGAVSSWADWRLVFDVDPARAAIPARLLGVACDALAIVGAARIAARLRPGADVLAAALLALAPTAITTSHSIFCDSLMTVFAVWAIERMLAWSDGGRPRDLRIAAALVGLATGSKYPAAALLAPLALLVFARKGARGLGPVAAAAAIAGGVFLLTTPWVILSTREFLRDLRFEGRHAEVGHFGSLAHRSFSFHASNLVRNLGWPGVLLLAGAIALAVRRRLPPVPVSGVVLAILGFGVPISLARIDAERYLLPILFLAAPLSAAALVALVGAMPAARRGLATGAGTALLLAFPIAGGIAAASRGASTTEAAAREWCERELGPGTLLVQEGYSASLPTALQMREYRGSPIYQHASPRARALVDTVRTFHVIALPLHVSGTTSIRPPGAARDVSLFAQAGEMNRILYEPRLYAGADAFMTSSAVRGRFTADPARYPVECAFYARLDSLAPVIARFAPAGERTGPEIVVHQLVSSFAAGDLPPLWWTTAFAPAVRAELDSVATGVAARDSLPRWVVALVPFYRRMVAPLVSDLASESLALGHDAAARSLGKATLAAEPDDFDASVVVAIAATRLDDWSTARAVSDRLARSQSPEVAIPFRFLRARCDRHLGHTDAARTDLAALVADPATPPDVHAAAAALLDTLGGAKPR